MGKLNLLGKLALRDLVYDRKVSLCIVASLVAVMTPLLLLFSLKYGVIFQLREQLLSNPSTLEVKIEGNLNLKKDWFEWLAKQPETKFSIPLTRSLNTQVDLRINSSRYADNVELIPTAKGDPILDRIQLTNLKHVVLSYKTAQRLKAKVGDELSLIVTRNVAGLAENQRTTLQIIDILDPAAFERLGAFVSLDLLIAVEDFRDGIYTVLFPTAQSSQVGKIRDSFSRARIYAKSLDDVEILAQRLNEQNINTITSVKKIQEVKAIDVVLNVIFLVIAITSIIGCILSLIGAFLANIDRKRKDIALLRLLGFQSRGVMLYLIVQAVMLSSVAFVAAYLFFLLGSALFNKMLSLHLNQSHFISSLEPLHLLFAFLMTFVLSAIVASVGAIRAIQIQPAESLRDV